MQVNSKLYVQAVLTQKKVPPALSVVQNIS